MANTPESISHIKIGQNEHPIDAVTVGGKSVADIKSDFSDDFQLKLFVFHRRALLFVCENFYIISF